VLTKFNAALAGWFRYAVFLFGGRVALLHAHMASRASFWRKLFFILPSFVFRVPVIVHLHGAEFQQFYGKESLPVVRRLIRFIFENASRVIVLSDGWREWARMVFPNAKVVAVYNPVVLPASTPFSGREPLTLLFLGRIGERKGAFDLIDAVAQIKGRFPGIRLLMGGDGEVEVARKRADDLGVSSNVELIGWVSGADKQALLESATVYVLPSYNEGLPMSVLEAMAAGLPVVSTPVGGIPEALHDGVEGFLVQPGNTSALAERLERLLDDASLRQRMGDAARQKVESTFSVGNIVPMIEAIYAELGVIIAPVDEDAASVEQKAQV
jgi:glycosyltransferase involved in cell wall biosynthesis